MVKNHQIEGEVVVVVVVEEAEALLLPVCLAT